MKYLGIIHLCFVMLFAVKSVSAQELDGLYYPFAYPHEQLPEIEIDSTLFYLPVGDDDNLFDQLTRYEFSTIRFQRRGVADQISELDGVSIDSRDSYMLRRLLRSEVRTDGISFAPYSMGGFVGSSSFRAASIFGLRRTATTISATDRNKLLTVRLYDARPLGEKWSYALSLSGEGGRDMRVEGVFTQRIEAAMAFTRQLKSGSLSLVAMVAPSQRGVRSASSNEVFELTGDYLYNPSWGFHDGKERSSRVRREVLPSVALSFNQTKGEHRWFATLYGRVGYRSISNLNWYDARIPTPDNYRLLPSYFDSDVVRDEVEQLWRDRDVRYTQINWDELYARNAMAGGRSVYIVEDLTEAPKELRALAGGEFDVARNTSLVAAVVAEYNNTEYYKRMRDLLGGEYIIDIDQFLVDDERFGSSLQNDMRNPDRRVELGDKFGYRYRLIDYRFGGRILLHYHTNRFALDVGGEIESVTKWREGLYEKQLFAGSGSFGRSQRLRSVDATAKASLRYTFSARHRVWSAVAVARRLQPLSQLLLQPAYNNAIAEVDPRSITSQGEVAYAYNVPSFSATVKGFYHSESNRTETMRLFDDLSYNYVDAVVSGITLQNFGAEFSSSVALSPRLWLEGALSLGSYRYATNPVVALYSDSDNSTIVEGAKSYMSGLQTAATPQLAALLRLRYSVPFGWRIDLNAAYATGRYVAPTPIRRMTRITEHTLSPEEFAEMTEQKRLKDALLIGASAMRSWEVGGEPSRLTLVLSVRNILSDNSLVYSAYEPSRILRQGSGANLHYRPMPERYTYAYPVSFNVSLTYKFR